MSVTGQQRQALEFARNSSPLPLKETMPVFRGLDDILLQNKEIATIVGVTAPTYSKWRSGKVRVPECQLVFLTLLLANWIDEQESRLGPHGGKADPRFEARLKSTRRSLYYQENINQSLPPETVREGSHLFREWWFNEGERCNKASRMAS